MPAVAIVFCAPLGLPPLSVMVLVPVAFWVVEIFPIPSRSRQLVEGATHGAHGLRQEDEEAGSCNINLLTFTSLCFAQR